MSRPVIVDCRSNGEAHFTRESRNELTPKLGAADQCQLDLGLTLTGLNLEFTRYLLTIYSLRCIRVVSLSQ